MLFQRSGLFLLQTAARSHDGRVQSRRERVERDTPRLPRHQTKMVFRIRLNNQDWYSEAPSELDPSLPKVSSVGGLPDVPIIRIYGTTADGEKVLAHVHGALPYIYVDYPGPYRVHGPDDNFSRKSKQAQTQLMS